MEKLKNFVAGQFVGSLPQADRHEGRRNPWLRALDQIGLGFDS